MNLTFDLSPNLQEKAIYSVNTNTLLLQNLTRADLGYQQVELVASEFRGGRKFSYRRSFYIIIVEDDDSSHQIEKGESGNEMGLGNGDVLQRENLVRGDRAGFGSPFVSSFDAAGLMRINWPYGLAQGFNPQSVQRSTLLARGMPRTLAAEPSSSESHAQD